MKSDCQEVFLSFGAEVLGVRIIGFILWGRARLSKGAHAWRDRLGAVEILSLAIPVRLGIGDRSVHVALWMERRSFLSRVEVVLAVVVIALCLYGEETGGFCGKDESTNLVIWHLVFVNRKDSELLCNSDICRQ